MGNDVLYEYESILMGKQKIFLLSFAEQTLSNQEALRTVWRFAIEHILRWTPEDALINLNQDILKKLKLDRTLKCIGINPSGRYDFRQILSFVYPGRIIDSTEIRVKDEVFRVLKIGQWETIKDPERGRFHKGFFSGEDGLKKAGIALNIVTELYLSSLSEKDKYRFFFNEKKALSFIKEVKLLPVMKNFYEFPLDYYYYSLPTSEKNPLLYFEYKIREEVLHAQKQKVG